MSPSKEGAYAKVCVRDDGVGIAPEMLEPIFELFVQSNRTLERAQGPLASGRSSIPT
jgi:signal transduction histidine kinase